MCFALSTEIPEHLLLGWWFIRTSPFRSELPGSVFVMNKQATFRDNKQLSKAKRITPLLLLPNTDSSQLPEGRVAFPWPGFSPVRHMSLSRASLWMAGWPYSQHSLQGCSLQAAPNPAPNSTIKGHTGISAGSYCEALWRKRLSPILSTPALPHIHPQGLPALTLISFRLATEGRLTLTQAEMLAAFSPYPQTGKVGRFTRKDTGLH